MVIWIKTFLIILVFLLNVVFTLNNQAPAEVKVRVTPYKLGFQVHKNEKLEVKICIDKGEQNCYYKFEKRIRFDMGVYDEITFATDDMTAKMMINLQLKTKNTTVYFMKRSFTLSKIQSSKTFNLRSIDLQSVTKIKISHQCELHYYPIGQCNVFCYEKPNVHTCDGFGNKICETGLSYDKIRNRCIENNCQKSKDVCGKNGICMNSGDSFMCVCKDPFIGKFCEEKNPCYSNPCKNNATCQLKKNAWDKSDKAFICRCKPDYSGELCATKITTKVSKSNMSSKCTCPGNMLCRYVGKDKMLMCVQNESSLGNFGPGYGNKENVQQNKDRRSVLYGNVTVSTVIVVGIGCIIFLLCIVVTMVVYFQTKNRNNHLNNQGHVPKGFMENPIMRHQPNFYPSTQYSQFSPSTFKRADSTMDQNSAYLFTGSPNCGTIPGPCFPGNNAHPLRLSSSINSNSYQEAPNHSNQMLTSVSMIPINGYNWQAASKPDIQQTPLLTTVGMETNSDGSNSKQTNFNTQSLPRGRGTSVISLDSDAPSLPPRPINLE